jgi:hemerythrin-like domain-containing protein
VTDLSFEEIEVQVKQMSDEDLLSLLERLQADYSKKQISLGHSITQEEEDRKRIDMMTDNALFMRAYKEIGERQAQKMSEAWRRFDDEAEEYIRRIKQHIEEKFSNGLK